MLILFFCAAIFTGYLMQDISSQCYFFAGLCFSVLSDRQCFYDMSIRFF